jgi:chromosomal replication initiation ATPase DnaA
MPRHARIDAPGALHHIIIRGIERTALFKDNADRTNFLERLGRIISDDFVERVLKEADEQLEEKYRLQVRVISLPAFVEKVAHYYKIDPENLKSASKERLVTKARRTLCYIAVRKLGYKCTDVAKTVRISAVTVSKAVSVGSKLPEIGKIQKQILGH